MLKQPGDNI